MVTVRARLEISNSEMPPGALIRRAPRGSTGTVSCPAVSHGFELRFAPPRSQEGVPPGHWPCSCPAVEPRAAPFTGSPHCGAAPEARQALRVTPASRRRPHPHVPSNVEKPAGAQQASHGEPRPLCMSPDLAAPFFGAPIISRHILPSPPQPVDTPADAHCRRVCATHLPFGLPRALDTCPLTHVGECCPARARGPGSPRVRLPCPPLRRRRRFPAISPAPPAIYSPCPPQLAATY